MILESYRERIDLLFLIFDEVEAAGITAGAFWAPVAGPGRWPFMVTQVFVFLREMVFS